jgi:hypothetical protein
VNRDEIAREGRRAQALEALAFEVEREAALIAQLQAVVLEDEGGRVDEAAFARMPPDDALRVAEALGTDGLDDDEGFDDDASDDGSEDEILRLQEAIDRCRAVQHSLERYVEALDGASSEISAGPQPRSGTA